MSTAIKSCSILLRHGAIYFLGLFVLTISPLNASQEVSPWFTGPLIAPSGTTVRKGVLNIQSYLYTTVFTGVYDKHWDSHSSKNFYSLNPSILIRYGLTDWFGILAVPQVFYNFTRGRSSFEFGDLAIGIELQLYPANRSDRFPGVKFAIKEFLPTGNYQGLQPGERGTDLSGLGTHGTYFNLLFYKELQIRDLHFLSTTLSFSYTRNSSVGVHGFNAYGGGFETRGTAFPGDFFSAIFSFEYSFNQNWVFALDNVYIHRNSSRFSGFPGRTSIGTTASVGLPSSDEVSFAPAIEYNFSKNFGIIAGVWFTAFGRSTPVFRSGVINFNYRFKPFC